jgi:hypothetical protein
MGGERRKRVSNLRRETEGVKGLGVVWKESKLLLLLHFLFIRDKRPSAPPAFFNSTKDARTAFHTFEVFDKFVTRSCGRREERS